MSRSVEVTTAEQLAALPDDGHRYELVEGVLRMMSPGDGRSEADHKTRDWLAAGVRVVLVVDPQHASLRVHRPGNAPVEQVEGLLDLRDMIPGFELDVAELFL